MADILSPRQAANATAAATDLIDRVQIVNNDGSKGVTLSSGESASDPIFTNHATTGGGVGRKTVTTAGTRVDLAATTAAKWVTITAISTNTGTVVVGPGAVIAAVGTREGTPLLALDTVTFPVDNLLDIKVDSTVNGEGVVYSYGT